MALTQRQQLLAAAHGEKLDKLPFGARIDLWYNYNTAHDTLPDKYKGWEQTAIIRDQGAGAQSRFHTVVKDKYEGVEVIEKNNPPYVETEYITPLARYQGEHFSPLQRAHGLAMIPKKCSRAKRTTP